MLEKSLIIDQRETVDWICLNRPQVSNALDKDLINHLYEYFEQLKNNRKVRLVVLHATGRNFCAGLDLKSIETNVSEDRVSELWDLQRRIGDIYRAMRRCPQPIVALLNGAAVGGGFNLALASDIRVATETTKMSAAYIKIGLTGADMGSSYFLPRLIGVSIASELLLTGKFIDAARSLSCGLVSEVVSKDKLRETGERICTELLQASHMGLSLTKEAIDLSIDAPSLEAAMALEDRHQVLLSMTREAEEAIRAFKDNNS